MEEQRKQAYIILLCAALLHLKYDLGIFGFGLSWTTPRYWRYQIRYMRISFARVHAFHNLAFYIAADMHSFDENIFWEDISRFERKFPDGRRSDYRALFEHKLVGEEITGHDLIRFNMPR